MVDAKKSLDAIRSEVCDTTLVVMSWLVIAALAISLSRVADVGWSPQYIGQAVGSLMVWGITFFRRRIFFHGRAITISAVLFWLGWTGQVYTPAPTSYVFFVSGGALGDTPVSIHGGFVGWSYVGEAAVYAGAYGAACLAIAAVLFSRRDLT